MPESSLYINVPDHARTVKARFDQMPDEEFIKQLKRQIANGTPPHLIECHTHTKPSADCRVIYLDEFTLPATVGNKAPLAPCPCCWPNHMKFRNGKIAWFPDEKVIRFIGPQCFKKLNKDEHEKAEAELKQRKRRQRDVAYLLSNAGTIKQSYEALKIAQKVAHAIRLFSAEISHTLEDRIALPLQAHTRNGELLIWEKVRSIDQATGEAIEKIGTRVYARISGYKILNPALKDYAFSLKTALQPAAFLTEFEDWKAWVSSASDEERHQAAKIVNQMVQRGRTLSAELRELQKFIEPLTINTLRTWGSKQESPITLLIERRQGNIYVGKTAGALFRVPIPEHFEDEIPFMGASLFSEMDEVDDTEAEAQAA